MQNKTKHSPLAVVIATYNRLPNLKSLNKFLAISDDLSHTMAINNTSSDGTLTYLKDAKLEDAKCMIVKDCILYHPRDSFSRKESTGECV
jgi:GT2 family glycosyltransferase